MLIKVKRYTVTCDSLQERSFRPHCTTCVAQALDDVYFFNQNSRTHREESYGRKKSFNDAMRCWMFSTHCQLSLLLKLHTGRTFFSFLFSYP